MSGLRGKVRRLAEVVIQGLGQRRQAIVIFGLNQIIVRGLGVELVRLLLFSHDRGGGRLRSLAHLLLLGGEVKITREINY